MVTKEELQARKHELDAQLRQEHARHAEALAAINTAAKHVLPHRGWPVCPACRGYGQIISPATDQPTGVECPHCVGGRVEPVL